LPAAPSRQATEWAALAVTLKAEFPVIAATNLVVHSGTEAEDLRAATSVTEAPDRHSYSAILYHDVGRHWSRCTVGPGHSSGA
jgi:hypothetical protein